VKIGNHAAITLAKLKILDTTYVHAHGRRGIIPHLRLQKMLLVSDFCKILEILIKIHIKT